MTDPFECDGVYEMKKLRSILMLLLGVVVGTCIARTEQATLNQVTLVYSAKLSPHSNTVLLKSPHGVTYQLSLVPDGDDLVLTLEKPGRRPDQSNLLDWTGRLHGYQPYDFGAWDFVNGVPKSIYGESRVIKLRKLGMEMRVKVVEVHVEPTADESGYQFEDLTLEITIQSLAEEISD
jgi:hypothetical protein